MLPLMSTNLLQKTVRFKDDAEVISPTEQQKRQQAQASSSSSSSNQLPPPDSAASGNADKPQGWWVHGHRVHNFHLYGITQENATRGRTRGGLGRGRESPQQEQKRLENPHLAGPVPAQIGKEEKKKRKEDTFPMDQMTCLMDSQWEKIRNWVTTTQISGQWPTKSHSNTAPPIIRLKNINGTMLPAILTLAGKWQLDTPHLAGK